MLELGKQHDTEAKALREAVIGFFRVYPPDEAKAMLLELYRGWTYSAPGMQQASQAEMLRFSESLSSFLDSCHHKAKKEQLEEAAKESLVKAQEVQDIVKLIAEAVRPEKVYLLGSTRKGEPVKEEYLELLVIIPTSNPSSFADLEPLVEFACLGNRKVSCTLSKSDYVQQMLSHGHVFYSFSCLPENMVYSNGSPGFTPTPAELLDKVRGDSVREFNANFSKATVFYETALQFRSGGNRELVPFMLHQAAELTLRALLISLLGKEKRTHSIAVLLRNVRRVAPAVFKVFPRDTERERRLVHLLEESYLQSRYESGFSLEEEVVIELVQRIGRLQEVARDVFEESWK